MAGATRTCSAVGRLVRPSVRVGRPSTPQRIISPTTSTIPTCTTTTRLASTMASRGTPYPTHTFKTSPVVSWALPCRGYRSRAEPPPPDRPEPSLKPHSTEHSAAHATASPASLPGTPQTSPAQPPATTPPKAGATGDVHKPEDVTDKEQSRRDWEIIKTLIPNIWPKNDWNTKTRVLVALGLLVGGKVSRAFAGWDGWRGSQCGVRADREPSRIAAGAQRPSALFFQEHHRRAQRPC